MAVMPKEEKENGVVVCGGFIRRHVRPKRDDGGFSGHSCNRNEVVVVAALWIMVFV